MNDDVPGTDAGPEADSTSYVEQLAEQQAVDEGVAELESEAEAPDSAPEEVSDDKPPLEPLAPEELARRHEDLKVALKQEREAKKQIREELAALRAQVEEQTTTQPQAFRKFTVEQQLAEYQNIDWQAWAEQDPVAANSAALQFKELVDEHERIQQETAQQQQARLQQQQQAQIQAFNEAAATQEAEFKKAHADYDAAFEHLRGTLREEANGKGWFGSHAEQYAQEQIIQIGFRVFTSGRDTAEFAYNEAKRRGYVPPAPDIASIKAGAEAAKSISTLGPKSANEGGSFEETMGNLSGAALKSFWADAKKKQYG